MSEQEQKFFQALEDLFVGAKIEGRGGFINLMKMKSRYYRQVEARLHSDINEALQNAPSFRDELFDKLHNFFHRYFTQNGSIYFNDTAFHNNVYEKIYTDEKDVVLFWKTQMLYYVKTDSIYRSIPVEFDDLKFHFDCDNLEHKKANEKKGLVFTFKAIDDDGTIRLEVMNSANGSTTKNDAILKEIKNARIDVTEEQLEKACRVFNRQSEVDYFINKNAGEFLKEQFKLWSYEYFWQGAEDWDATRVNQLAALKKIAFNIIDFIAQFEDELVKIWNKPKFARKANYVITLDRIDDDALITKIKAHPGYAAQKKEWQSLGIAEANPKAPIDTKHFKDLELEILALFENLDEALDGWLIKSENYQALNTILPKFKERVQTIYIDPPFNLGTNGNFHYNVNYKDSSWATLLENRLKEAYQILHESGSIFVRCDYNGNWILRPVLNNIFDNNFKNEIILSKSAKVTEKINRYHSDHDTLFFYAKNENCQFEPVTKKRINPKWRAMHLPGTRWSPMPKEFVKLFSKENLKIKNGNFTTTARIILGKELLPPVGRHWALSQNAIFELEKEGKIRWNENGEPQTQEAETQLLTDNWTDWVGYSSTWGFMTENHEKVIERAIRTSSFSEKDIVFDFFLGSGTTTAVAHKLGQKWIGVEMGDHFHTTIVPRMKEVLAGSGEHEPSGISREVNWQGGGFFKYYNLEQYEEALANCKYEDGDLFTKTDASIYEQYVFMPDEKMLEAIQLDYENNKTRVDLSRIYPDIDIAETLSNLTGKWIKSITPDKVVFADGHEIDTKNLDLKTIRPLIWWEK